MKAESLKLKGFEINVPGYDLQVKPETVLKLFELIDCLASQVLRLVLKGQGRAVRPGWEGSIDWTIEKRISAVEVSFEKK